MDTCSILLLLMAVVVGTSADVPALTQYPEASDPYIIDYYTNVTTFPFNCSVRLNGYLNNPKIYWRAYNFGMKNQTITAPDEFGVKAVESDYNQTGGAILSRLDLEVTFDTQLALRDTKWQCVLEYSTLNDSTILFIAGDPVEFTIVSLPVICIFPGMSRTKVSIPKLSAVIASSVGVGILVAVIGLVVYRRKMRRDGKAGTEVENGYMSLSTKTDN